MAKGKGLFPRRPYRKGENGRTDCMACPDSTLNEKVIVIHDPKRPIGDQTVRGHQRCDKKLLKLVDHWELNTPTFKIIRIR